MIKGRDEKFENKGLTVNYLNGNYFSAPPPLNRMHDDHVSAPADNISRDGTEEQRVRKDNLGLEEFSGFIFMCNGRTKPECYLYRVFGLPAGRREVIEKIRPGIKLFLFDYEVKFLYGVYEATTAGMLNLQRTAFGGNFPAQVRFEIYKECLPLPESQFKHAIQDNYQQGSKKFNPILNSQQVIHLLSLFQPLTMSSSTSYDNSSIKDQFHPLGRLPPPGNTYLNSTHPSHAPQVFMPQHDPLGVPLQQWDSHRPTGNIGFFHHAVEHPALPNVGSQPAMQAQATEGQFQSPESLPSMNDPNAAQMYSGHASPVLGEPQYIQPSFLHPQHASYGYTAYTGYVYPSVQPQVKPASNQTYYSVEAKQPYWLGVPAPSAPKLYGRYEATQDMVPTYQHFGSGYEYNQLPLQPLNAAEHRNLHQVPTAPYGSLPTQQHAFTLEEPEPEPAAGTLPISSLNSQTGAIPT